MEEGAKGATMPDAKRGGDEDASVTATFGFFNA